jgi:uncharacterized protein with PQ loop repeat
MSEITFAWLCGAIGNILFGFKSLFQVINCYKHQSTAGLSMWMCIADFCGNIACAYYIFSNTGMKLFWQYINYGLATLWLIILFVMMFFYKN